MSLRGPWNSANIPRKAADGPFSVFDCPAAIPSRAQNSPKDARAGPRMSDGPHAPKPSKITAGRYSHYFSEEDGTRPAKAVVSQDGGHCAEEEGPMGEGHPGPGVGAAEGRD